MPVRAGEFFGIGTSVRGGPVEVAADGDRRHPDHGTFEQPGFQVTVLRLALSEAQPPPVIVYDDVDVIGIGEECGGAVKRAVVEAHFGDAICQISLLNSRQSSL
jgi:hypothetical protein